MSTVASSLLIPNLECLEGGVDSKVAVAPKSKEPSDEEILADYDAFKFKYDYTSTKTAFDLPTTHPIQRPLRFKGKYNSHLITANQPNFKAEISKYFLQNVYRQHLQSHIRFIDATRVQNTQLHDEMMELRQKLVISNENTDFTYLFMIAPGYNPEFEDHIFANGAKCGNLPADFLGNPNTGVYLSKHPDTCTLAPLIPFVPYRVIIFKALLGHSKSLSLVSKTGPQSAKPDADFGAIVSTGVPGCTSLYEIFLQSLVYSYDKINQSEFHLYPRTLYPYAAVTFYIDKLYPPKLPFRLPWFSKNIVGHTTLKCSILFNVEVDIYRLYNNHTPLTELFLDGINVSKMIKFSDLGKWKIIKEIFSGIYGSFSTTDRLHITASNTCDFFVYYCTLASKDLNFAKFSQAMIVPEIGAVFNVPNIPVCRTDDGAWTRTIGLLLPNSAFASLFGIPIIPGDVLHCLLFHRITVGAGGHPVRTMKREELLIGMSKANRVNRSDKVSDNDIKSALFHTLTSQVNSLEVLFENEPESPEEQQLREQQKTYIIRETTKYDEPMFTEAELDEIAKFHEEEYQKYFLNASKSIPEFYPINGPPVKVPRKKPLNNNVATEVVKIKDNEPEIMEVDEVIKKPAIVVAPTSNVVKTAVVLEPKLLLDTQIPPSVLESLLNLTASYTKNHPSSQLTVVYHQCMRGSRLTDNLNMHRTVVSPELFDEYIELEKKYSTDRVIQFAEEHSICDGNNKNTLTSYLICLLTILRKFTFNNAVFLTYTATPDNVENYRRNKISLLTPDKYVELLKAEDTSFFIK